MTPVDGTRGAHNNSSVGRDALDVALNHGGTQYGCCPKTIASPSNSGRRVIIGNLGDYNPGKGGAGSTGTEVADENTPSLPHDLSVLVSGDGESQRREILQQYVPELQKLRVASSHEARSMVLAPSSDKLPVTWLELHGKQLELMLRLTPSKGAALPTAFGVQVLATNGSKGHTAQRTRITVMRNKQLFAIDRTQSAGPLSFWPALDNCSTSDEFELVSTTLLMHVYVDGSVVSVIAGNRTAVTVHVHPNEAAIGVALFAEGRSASVHVAVEGWQLMPNYFPPPNLRQPLLKTEDREGSGYVHGAPSQQERHINWCIMVTPSLKSDDSGAPPSCPSNNCGNSCMLNGKPCSLPRWTPPTEPGACGTALQ